MGGAVTHRVLSTGVGLAVIAAIVIALVAFTKHTEDPPAAGTAVIEVEVQVHGERVHDEPAVALWNACSIMLPAGFDTAVTVVDRFEMTIVVTPKPSAETLRPLLGCLNDLTLDRLEGTVVDVDVGA